MVRISQIFRIYIIDELRNKTEMSEQEIAQYAGQFMAKTCICPQVLTPFDNGIYFVKMLKLIADD